MSPSTWLMPSRSSPLSPRPRQLPLYRESPSLPQKDPSLRQESLALPRESLHLPLAGRSLPQQSRCLLQGSLRRRSLLLVPGSRSMAKHQSLPLLRWSLNPPRKSSLQPQLQPQLRRQLLTCRRSVSRGRRHLPRREQDFLSPCLLRLPGLRSWPRDIFHAAPATIPARSLREHEMSRLGVARVVNSAISPRLRENGSRSLCACRPRSSGKFRTVFEGLSLCWAPLGNMLGAHSRRGAHVIHVLQR